MNVSLTPELEQFIQSQVESGKYTSADEVILAGIRLLEERDRTYKGRFEELQKEIKLGIDSAEREEVVDGETVFQQLQVKMQQRRAQVDRWAMFVGLLGKLVEILKVLSTLLLIAVVSMRQSVFSKKLIKRV